MVDGVRQEDQNPAEASLLWATGTVVGDDGTANFHARLLRRFSLGEVLFGPRLTNAKGAEVHLVVRTHGKVLPDAIAGQVSSFGLGCNPECANVQAAIHKP